MSLNDVQALVQVGLRQLIILFVLYLNHQGWSHFYILMLTIRLPMLAFTFPVLCGFRQIGHLGESLSCLRMVYFDLILQQT